MFISISSCSSFHPENPDSDKVSLMAFCGLIILDGRLGSKNYATPSGLDGGNPIFSINMSSLQDSRFLDCRPFGEKKPSFFNHFILRGFIYHDKQDGLVPNCLNHDLLDFRISMVVYYDLILHIL
jgi:hypothetical protein